MKRVPSLGLVILALVLLLVLTGPALADEAKGRIKTLDLDKSSFVMADDNNKDWTINAAKDCKVFLNDKESKLADLKADDKVTVTYAKDGEKINASEIRAKRD